MYAMWAHIKVGFVQDSFTLNKTSLSFVYKQYLNRTTICALRIFYKHHSVHHFIIPTS